MTNRFTNFLPFILEWETEYLPGHHGDDRFVKVERDPDDPGGTTKYGIDQRSHPNIDIAHLRRESAIDVYFDEWERSGCETMAGKLGEVYFNARVNCGTGRAQKLLAASTGEAERFLVEQAAFYRRLAEARPKSAKYLKGWLNRVNALRKFLHL